MKDDANGISLDAEELALKMYRSSCNWTPFEHIDHDVYGKVSAITRKDASWLYWLSSEAIQRAIGVPPRSSTG